jgi:hypothetical protein
MIILDIGGISWSFVLNIALGFVKNTQNSKHHVSAKIMPNMKFLGIFKIILVVRVKFWEILGS